MINKFLNYDTGELYDTMDEMIQKFGPIGCIINTTDFTSTTLFTVSKRPITEKQAAAKYHQVKDAIQDRLL